jgi:diguanylate cyclase (GGDEF)-like protein/PAS domain S-box-containing protein
MHSAAASLDATLLDLLPSAVLVLDGRDRIVEANDTARDWFTLDYLDGEHRFSELLTGAGTLFFETHIRPLLHRNDTVRSVMLEVRAHGELLAVNLSARRLPDGTVLVVLLDATYQKAYETELDLRRQLAEQEAHASARFRAAFGDAVSAMAIIEARDSIVILEANRAFCALVGKTRESLARYRLAELFGASDAFVTENILVFPDRALAPLGCELAITSGDGTTLTVRTTASQISSDDDLVGQYVLHIEDITPQRALEARLAYDASHDGLTGLVNRRAITRELERRMEHPSAAPTAVMFIDVDHFKSINDELGHAAGDSLLVQVSDRLRRAVRQQDLVGRLGGDEFIVICPDVDSLAAARNLAARVVEVGVEPFTLGSGTVTNITLSVGVALAPLTGTAAELLIRSADDAMYVAKRAGRNNAVVVDTSDATDAT